MPIYVVSIVFFELLAKSRPTYNYTTYLSIWGKIYNFVFVLDICFLIISFFLIFQKILLKLFLQNRIDNAKNQNEISFIFCHIVSK